MQNWTLPYDSECDLCVRFSQQVQRFDKDNLIRVIPLEIYCQDSEIPCSDLFNELHFISDDGQILRGGEAIQKVIELIPAMAPLQHLVESKLGQVSSRGIYKVLDRLRWFRKRKCKKCRK